MKAKLDGRDPDPGYRMNVSEQVSGWCAIATHVTLLLCHFCYRSSSLLRKLPVLITFVSCTKVGLPGCNNWFTSGG